MNPPPPAHVFHYFRVYHQDIPCRKVSIIKTQLKSIVKLNNESSRDTHPGRVYYIAVMEAIYETVIRTWITGSVIVSNVFSWLFTSSVIEPDFHIPGLVYEFVAEHGVSNAYERLRSLPRRLSFELHNAEFRGDVLNA